MIKFFLITILVSSAIFAQAQEKYNLTKYYNMPFKEDSVTTFNKELVENGICNSIKGSDAEMEVRFTLPFCPQFKQQKHGDIYQVKYFKDSIVASKITYQYLRPEQAAEYTSRGYKVEIKSVYPSIATIVKVYKPDTFKIDSSFYNLVQNNFFITEDQSNIENKIHFDDSVKKYRLYQNMRSIPCSYFVEIKRGGIFRNFYIRAFTYYDEIREIEILKINSIINNFLNNFLIKYEK